MSGYIGVVPLPQATQTRDVFTATSGQTSFATSGYTPNFLDVWLNGVKLINGDDFTATNGSDVVLTTGAAAGDTVEVLSYSTYEVNAQTYTGGLTVNNDAATVLTVDRATSDGSIIDVQKDGVSSGGIGVAFNQVTIGKGSTGLLFNGTDTLYPWDFANNTNADNTFNIGRASTRFKDLYLSGGVYLGGTSAANKLDDYEEGTWTPVLEGSSGLPTVTYSDNYGYYTKIGRFVHVYGRTQIGSISGGSGYLFIYGLPFTVNSSAGRYATGSLGYVGGWNTVTPLALIAPHNTTRFEMYGATGTSARDSISSIIYLSYAQSGSDIIFSLSYETT